MHRFDHNELIKTAPINFAAHGPHWLEVFTEVLAKSDSGIQFSYLERQSSFEGTIIRLTLGGAPLKEAAVKVIPSDTRTEFWLTLSGPDKKHVSTILKEAVEFATEEAGRTSQHFRWSAILTQVPQAMHRSTRLTTKIHIGELTIEPEDVVFADVVHPGKAFDGTYRVHRSHPIRVEGKTQASSWESASVKADRTLRMLCGLLALNWDPAYEVATSAVNFSHGKPPIRATRAGIQVANDHGEYPFTWEDHPAPEYSDEAWRMLNSSMPIQHALDAYLEARYIEELHQAFALVAYVASIEAIARMLFEHQECGGLTKAFKAALRVVLPEGEAETLGRVYSWRSQTVHQGRLHGTGRNKSHSWFDLFNEDVFSNLPSLLPRLRRSAEMLLVKALRGALPPKQRLEDTYVP